MNCSPDTIRESSAKGEGSRAVVAVIMGMIVRISAQATLINAAPLS